MKNFITFIMFFLFSISSFAQNEPSVVGKIVKTKHENYGTNYFITFKRDNKQLAFPISANSQIKNLHELEGETVKLYGKTFLKKSEKKEVAYIMFFEANKVTKLSTKDLAYKPDFTNKADEVNYYLNMQRKVESDKAQIKGVSNKAANTAIFIGGAILAAEVLGKVLSN